MREKKQALNYFKNGNLIKAKQLYDNVVSIHPNDAEAHYMLGVIYAQTGEYNKAESRFKKARKLSPKSAMTTFGLATLYRSTNPREAAKLYEEAYRINPALLDACYGYATVSYSLHEHKNAQDACFNLLAKNSDYYKAWFLLGDIKKDKLDHKSAITYYKNAIKIKPDFGEAYFQLGMCYYRAGDIKNAIDSLEKSVKHVTPSYDPYSSYGIVLMAAGEIEKAKESYNTALRNNSKNIEAITGIASLYIHEREYDKANDLLLPLIKAKNVPSYNIVNIYIKICDRFDTSGLLLDYIEYIEHMESLKDSMNKSSLGMLKLSKAKIYENLNDFDAAFKEYKAGNKLFTDTYNRIESELVANEIQSVFTYEYLLTRKKSSVTNKYIFIVGMPRSGTSLVEQVLDSHSKVYGAGELTFIGKIAKTMRSPIDETQYPQCMPSLDEAALTRYAKSYIKQVEALVDTDADVIVDKMPHNFFYIGLIKQLFPESKIVHCRRNPIDTCLSIYFQSFNDSHAYANNLTDIAHQYKIYSDTMKHWCNMMNDKIYTIDYEKLVENFDTEAQSLFKFCDLNWEENCSEFYNNRRYVKTASQDQVNKPLYNTSVARWKNYENNISELIEELKGYDLID